MIRFSPSHLITVDAAAAGETPRRSISGVAVEWNQVAIVSSGEQVLFMKGSLPVDGRNPKLYLQHDPVQIIGQVVERIDSGDALMFRATISATELGNTALTLIRRHAFRGFSRRKRRKIQLQQSWSNGDRAGYVQRALGGQPTSFQRFSNN